MHTGHENRLGHTLVGGCCNSSVDSSAPTILPPQVRVPSMPSMLLPFIVKFVLYLSCEKNENKQKEAGLGPFLKHICYMQASGLLYSYNSC